MSYIKNTYATNTYDTTIEITYEVDFAKILDHILLRCTYHNIEPTKEFFNLLKEHIMHRYIYTEIEFTYAIDRVILEYNQFHNKLMREIE